MRQRAEVVFVAPLPGGGHERVFSFGTSFQSAEELYHQFIQKGNVVEILDGRVVVTLKDHRGGRVVA